MATVIERLREAEKCRHETCECVGCCAIAFDALPALRALADAVKKMVDNPAWQGMCDQDVAVEKALAELEKEAP